MSFLDNTEIWSYLIQFSWYYRGCDSTQTASETPGKAPGQKPGRRDCWRTTGREDDARSSPDQKSEETGDSLRSRTRTGPGATREPHVGVAGPARNRRARRDSTPARAFPHAPGSGRSTATASPFSGVGKRFSGSSPAVFGIARWPDRVSRALRSYPRRGGLQEPNSDRTTFATPPKVRGALFRFVPAA